MSKINIEIKEMPKGNAICEQCTDSAIQSVRVEFEHTGKVESQNHVFCNRHTVVYLDYTVVKIQKESVKLI